MICYSLYSFFTWSSVTLYLFFGHILLNCYRLQVLYSMEYLRSLDMTLHSLHKLFGPILLSVCCSGILSMITSSYFLIRCIFDGSHAFVFVWDVIEITESLTKVVLICWMADRLIRLPAMEFISVVRRLRDKLSKFERIKVFRSKMYVKFFYLW